MRNKLHAITLKGFKTIQELDDFKPGPLTVLIGPNGAGKSNFISFFRMMSWMLADPRQSSISRGATWWSQQTFARRLGQDP